MPPLSQPNNLLPHELAQPSPRTHQRLITFHSLALAGFAGALPGRDLGLARFLGRGRAMPSHFYLCALGEHATTLH